ncbi:tRNA lysidine(34) synthetase TilS [Immundisolibacter sp.]|uniref:tRNA lysidine(34) synthetase TilS n=1 Tax=Immundisolibacter sp. TaxID=1934948 RepID=UPI002629C373|nr:tRNA lysidine(34) synthetase TilS [Immundisolibacter sp.]MDD3650565.1 tRNA lysidine(34) synthetase TilS [Immundisolibacter sp.]
MSDAPGLALICAALAHSPAPVTLRVAYSGGRDSHVLLHWLAGQRAALAPHRLLAVHVDHGLQAEAARWAEHCAMVCAALGVPLQTHRIDARPAPGESPEAAARRARYAALAADMQDGDLLLTAHHQTDQAETVRRALLRGAGVAGAAAMPAQKRFGRGSLLRPLLAWPAERVARYAREHELAWVEDPSNRDARFDRNFLRSEVLPLLARRWPAATATLARHACHAADAQALLDDLANADGATVGQLTVARLAALSPTRQRNLLRAWLHHHGAAAPSTARLDELLRQALTAAADRLPCVAFGEHAVRVWRGRLYLTAEPLPPPPQPLLWQLDAPLELPGIGRLRAQLQAGTGIELAALGEPPTLEVRFRGTAGGHTLRKRLQELAVPPWQRERWPLLYRGDRLLQIAGHAPMPAVRAGPGEAGVQVIFEPG